MEMGSGLDFATFMNSALRNGNCGDNMWGGQNGLLWIFLLLLCGWGGNGYGNRGQAVNDRAVTETVEAAIQKARAVRLSNETEFTRKNAVDLWIPEDKKVHMKWFRPPMPVLPQAGDAPRRR